MFYLFSFHLICSIIHQISFYFSGFARRAAEEFGEQYGGEQGKNLMGGLLNQLAAEGGNSELTENLMAMFTGKQQVE